MKRRSFFGGMAGAGLVPAVVRAAKETPKLAEHRNLFTGDSCVYFYNPELFHPEGLPYTAKAIHRYVDLLADNGVDTFLSNPNASVAWYPSKHLQTVIDGYQRGNRDFFRGHAIATHVPAAELDAFLDHMVQFFNLYLDLADAGVDWLAETTKACRRRKISPWVSIRMNDTHGVENPEGSHFNCALVKKKEFRLSGVLPDPSLGTNAHWMALNYDKPEVRDFTFSHIRESVQDYDFEGLELDWLRDPHCCEPGATQAQADKITAWIGNVRALTQAQGKKIGKPYPMGMRIPGNLGYLRSRGLDVRAIVTAGYVDFLNFSNHWQTTWDMPYDELRRELGPDVVFYGVVEDAPNWIPGYSPANAKQGTRYMAASPQMQRANAAGKLAMGVHGIEQFNFFCTDQPTVPGLRADYSVLRNTHDLNFLRGKPKHYCLSTPTGRASTAWELPEQLPAVIDAKGRRQFRLSMCSEPAGAKLIAQVVLEKPSGAVRLGVSVNGKWPVFESQPTKEMLFAVGPYTQHIPENAAYNFTVQASDLKEGWNTFTISNSASAVKLVSIELGVFA